MVERVVMFDGVSGGVLSCAVYKIPTLHQDFDTKSNDSLSLSTPWTFSPPSDQDRPITLWERSLEILHPQPSATCMLRASTIATGVKISISGDTVPRVTLHPMPVLI